MGTWDWTTGYRSIRQEATEGITSTSYTLNHLVQAGLIRQQDAALFRGMHLRHVMQLDILVNHPGTVDLLSQRRKVAGDNTTVLQSCVAQEPPPPCDIVSQEGKTTFPGPVRQLRVVAKRHRGSPPDPLTALVADIRIVPFARQQAVEPALHEQPELCPPEPLQGGSTGALPVRRFML